MRKLLFLCLILATHFSYGQYSGTPLMLSLPMNQDTIEEDEPVFVWQTTLSNVQNDPRLNVQLAVVKMEEDQAPAEAIAENAPVFIRQNLLSNTLNYSSIDHQLEEGTWYAWQVVLFYNGVQVQQSEVWKFIKAKPVEPMQGYYVLKPQIDNSFIELDGKVLNVTTRESGDFQLKATITGNKISPQTIYFEETELVNEQTDAVSIQRVESRYFSCDLSDLKLKKGNYRIQWDASSDKQFILFIKKK